MLLASIALPSNGKYAIRLFESGVTVGEMEGDGVTVADGEIDELSEVVGVPLLLVVALAVLDGLGLKPGVYSHCTSNALSARL